MAGVDGNKPLPQDCVCCVCRSPVNGIHLVLERLDGCLDEISRSAISSAAPNNVRGHAVIPLGDFAHNAFAFFGFGEVSTDIVKPLLVDIGSGTLGETLTKCT